MRPDDLNEVRHLPLFRDMLKSNFDSLMQGAYAQSFPKELELIRQGGSADFLHVVLEGAVELYSTWQDQRSTMAVVHPVGTFILAACIKDAPYLMSARTIERSRILLVPASDLRAVFRRDPEFAVSTIGELAGCYREVVRHAKNLKLRSSRERVASYLLKEGRTFGAGGRFTLSVEKRMIASFLGMTPENLSRAIKSLEEFGVEVRGQVVTLGDYEKLAQFAPPDALIDGPDRSSASEGTSLPPSLRPRGEA